jgi:hypothetical protein
MTIINGLRLAVVTFFTALAVVGTFLPADAEPPECVGTPAQAALPDLRTVVPQHLNLVNQQKREILRFSNGIANVGAGPLELEPLGQDRNSLEDAFQNVYAGPTSASALVCRRSLADAFLFHPEHNHWHLKDVALFGVHPAAGGDSGTGGQWGSPLGALSKESFCLIDFVPINGAKPKSRTYFDCFGIQGISVSWVDEYHHSTEGQEVDITGAPAGIYYLVSTANAAGVFLESDITNNTAWISFRLSRDSSGNAKISVITNSPCAGELCGYATNR